MTATRPTLIEVAAAAGVSKSTASLALRGAAVSPEARTRVLEAARALGYVYDRAAAAIRGARSGTVGLIAFDMSNPFYAEFCAGVSERLDQAGSLALMADTREDLGRQARLLQRMREHRLDGLILCPAVGSLAQDIQAQLPTHLPVVQALRRIEGLRTDYVGAENEAGAAEAVRHLLSLGHRQIGYAGQPHLNSVQRERFAGVSRTLAQNGLPPPLLFECPPSLVGGVAAAEAAFRHADRPTALLCFNDVVAIGALSALARRGMKAGEAMSIVGFDDIDEAALRSPALTTVSIRPREMGAKAAQLLLDRLDNLSVAPTSILQNAKLMIRETTGPVCPDEPVPANAAQRPAS